MQQNCYFDHYKVTLPPMPLPYQEWAEAHCPTSEESLSAYMSKEETKRAYADYFLADEATYQGDWSVGMIHREDGSYHPFSTRIPFHEADWDRWRQYTTFFTTRSAAEPLLWAYLRGERPSIWGREDMVLTSDLEANGIGFSKSYGAYYSFVYTVPPAEAGWVSPYIRPSEKTELHKSVRFVVLHNEQPIWPEGAVLADPETWMKDFLCKDRLYLLMEDLSLEVQAGDRIHFVLEGEIDQRLLLDPVVLLQRRDTLQLTEAPSAELVSRNGAAIPAMPNSAVDLWQYRVWIGDEEVPGDAISWMTNCKELEAPVWRRYLLTPSEAGVYSLTARWKDQVIPVQVAVCDQSGTYPTAVLPHRADATLDMEAVNRLRPEIQAHLDETLSYWCGTLSTVADEVLRHRRDSDDLSEFFFLTDTHHEINHQRSIPVANCLSDTLGIDRLFFGGDFMNGQDTLADSLVVRDDWLSMMNSFHGFWYPARGNHDTNTAFTPFTVNDFWPDADYYRYILRNSGACAQQAGMRVVRSICPGMRDRHDNLLTEVTEDCLFYYLDDEKARIRYYFLEDGVGGLLDEVGDYYNIANHPTVNVIPYAEQLKWLQYTALEGEDALQDGWGLVVVEHIMFNPYPLADWVPDLSSYYRALTAALHEILPTLTERGAEIIAVLSGHTHWDGSCQAEDGYPVIATTCDADFLGQKQEHLALERYAGSATEQAFDIVQIDRQHHRLYLTRVGSGQNRSFSYRGLQSPQKS